jgi:hypothetical protein
MTAMSRTVERRIATFDREPTDEDLGTDLGYGLMGGSTHLSKDDDKFFQIDPQRIPVKLFAIWMYVVVAVIGLLVWFLGFDEPLLYAMVIGAAVVIVPVMIAAMAWLNDATGNQPFIIFDKKADQIELPRLSVKYSRSQLREVIFVSRFVDRSEHQQVGLVVEEGNGQWTYLHLFNTAHQCSGNGEGWLGFKDIDQKIAEALGITNRRISFTKAESSELGSLVPWLDRRATA